jgi:hypothetical protein
LINSNGDLVFVIWTSRKRIAQTIEQFPLCEIEIRPARDSEIELML